ncbi:MAG: hypothetical protein Q9190_006500 [Brigantiaea leucoxantha]
MTAGFKHTELFGEAITVNIPNEYSDVSDIRQVPDHQEVYLSTTGFTSIIVEIAERVSHPPTDHDALKFHFEDIVLNEDTGKVWRIDDAPLPKFPQNTPAYSLLATTIPKAAPDGIAPTSRPVTPAFTAVLLTLIRLVPQLTDLVITINIPHIPGHQESNEPVDFEQGQLGSLVEDGRRIRDEIWRTLEIKDWGLFDVGDE